MCFFLSSLLSFSHCLGWFYIINLDITLPRPSIHPSFVSAWFYFCSLSSFRFLNRKTNKQTKKCNLAEQPNWKSKESSMVHVTLLTWDTWETWVRSDAELVLSLDPIDPEKTVRNVNRWPIYFPHDMTGQITKDNIPYQCILLQTNTQNTNTEREREKQKE